MVGQPSRGRQRGAAEQVSSSILTAMGTQERNLKSSCRCSLSLSNICSWWLLLSAHSLQSSARPRSSLIAIVANGNAAEGKHAHVHHARTHARATADHRWIRLCRAVPREYAPRAAGTEPTGAKTYDETRDAGIPVRAIFGELWKQLT